MPKHKGYTDDGEKIEPMQEVERPPPVPLADEMLASEYTPFFKTPYNHDTLRDAALGALVCAEGSSLTQVHLFEETEINGILRRFRITGELPIPPMPPIYRDIPARLDMAEMETLVSQGYAAFDALPQEQRNYFGSMNNYVHAVDEMVRTNDLEGLRKLNLVPPEPQSDPPPSPNGDSSAKGGDKAAS